MIRKRLIAGFFTILPLGVTVWFLKTIFQILVEIFHKPLLWVASVLGLPPPNIWQQAVFSVLALGLLLFLIGILIQNFIGRQLLTWLDTAMMNIPGIKSVYGATKQVMNAIQNGKGGSFKEVVIVPWPNPDSRTIGFIAQRGCSWALDDGKQRVAVYIPTAPIPTSGYVVMLEESVIQKLDVTPEQALTWVVSGGVATPTMMQKNSKIV
ncbi:MAG: DUF502 domain-containing protein [Holophagaceae bacterium]|nr:DUF502 domain-containing protein [Holophagaceae bacterium]